MMRKSNVQRPLSSKRKTPSLGSLDNPRKLKHSKMLEGQRKIPHIINQLQENLILLRKYYFEDKASQKTINLFKSALKRPTRSVSSLSKQKVKKFVQDHAEEQITTIAQIDDLKKSFLSMHGYDTNNIVELYNFYKKNLEKSTRLFGSTSMSNMINLTQNQSQIREKCLRPNSGSVVFSQEIAKEKQDKQKLPKQTKLISDKSKLPQIHGENAMRRSAEMVNVATLLAQKKKISRKNICENMNSQHLLNQAKKRLYRPHPNDNIERVSKLKQNMRNENIRISPGRKLKNMEGIKQRSSSKKSNRKQEQVNNSFNQINHFEKPSVFTIGEQAIRLEKNTEKEQPLVIVNVVTQERYEKKQDVKNLVSPNPNEREKELKSAKSIKSIKSPSSIRSPSLNQAVLLDLTISGDPSSNKRHQPTYFVPKVHPNNLNDSLLDCEITPKEQSKILDLESIPFDF